MTATEYNAYIVEQSMLLRLLVNESTHYVMCALHKQQSKCRSLSWPSYNKLIHVHARVEMVPIHLYIRGTLIRNSLLNADGLLKKYSREHCIFLINHADNCSTACARYN